MVKPFVHLQLRKDHRIVKRRGNLADSAAVSLYGRSVFVRSCQFIAVFGIKWTDYTLEYTALYTENCSPGYITEPLIFAAPFCTFFALPAAEEL